MSDDFNHELYHHSMRSIPAHEGVFRGLMNDQDQARHLLVGHRVRSDQLADELGRLHRDEPHTFNDTNPATLADVHEWWHIRQRRHFDRQFDAQDNRIVDGAS